MHACCYGGIAYVAELLFGTQQRQTTEAGQLSCCVQQLQRHPNKVCAALNQVFCQMAMLAASWLCWQFKCTLLVSDKLL
jgi:hypothetical protein